MRCIEGVGRLSNARTVAHGKKAQSADHCHLITSADEHLQVCRNTFSVTSSSRMWQYKFRNLSGQRFFGKIKEQEKMAFDLYLILMVPLKR